MASSRSPSPVEARSPPATPLTPQSKLKVLFAAVDGSSDDEQGSAAAKRTEKTVTQAPFADAAASPSAESTDDEDIVRPRGRMAARMQAGNTSRQEQYTSRRDSSPEPEGDARERVKRMLQDAARPDTAAVQAATSENTDNQDQEKDTVTPRPRKLKNRVRQSVTPEDAAPARDESPGLFVSPNKDQSPIAASGAQDSGSDADLPTISMKNKRFQELVAKKRAERLAREAEEERKKAARIEAQVAADDHFMEGDDDSDITDDEGGRKLTQEVRPTRKASKKALEEMNRETQRLHRSLQLAHEAKTRKKISKSSLFERFNFRPSGPPAAEKSGSSSGPATPVSAHHTDTEMKDADTPPTSPPAPAKDHTPSKAVAPLASIQKEVETEQALPSLEGVLTQARQDKGKGIATAAFLEPLQGNKPPGKRQVRVKLPIDAHLMTLDSDDELVVTETKKSKIDAIFDRIPAKKQRESRSMHALRYLAQIGSPGKEARKKDKKSLTAVELQAMLQQRARQQAKMERDRRFELLKAKGIHIQTEEEREREMAEVEDIVARARQEAEEIMQREREAAKQERKERRENGEVDPLAWDDSEGSDDEYEEREEPSEIELSGSEDDEDMNKDDGDGDEAEADRDASKTALFDGEAESTGESGDEQDASEEDGGADAESDDEAVALPAKKQRRAKKHAVVLSDDDEDGNDEDGNDDIVAKTPKPKSAFPKSPSVQHNSDSPQVPTSVLRSATKTFIPGLPVVAGGPAGLGLTQIFAGTLDESQAAPLGFSPSQPMPTFTNLPDSQFSQQAEDQTNEMIQDSQPTQRPAAAATQAGGSISQGIEINFSQSQVHGFESLLREPDATQLSQLVDPSQDGGYGNYTPLKERFVEAPPSTVETIALNRSQLAPSQNDSPLVQRRGKLRRKIAVGLASDDEAGADNLGDMDADSDNEETRAATAFSLMKEAAAKEQKRKALETFNKKKSKAKEMVEDQAEESEDEYAGLGGADGEDSDDESDASVKDMIDDEHKSNEIEERKIAAFYADRERASDERQVDKLFRDLTSGMLRRKRGADYDLSDSDDGGEARRRMKRRQFAKMQKALFADDRISKVAENPRNQAFLRTIEDHGSDDEMDFLFEPTPAGGHGTVSASQDTAIPDSQPGQDRAGSAAGPATQAHPRLPAAQRRTRGGRKPATLGEIRESLSNLLDEPGAAVIPASVASSDSSDDDNDDAEEARRRPTSSSSSNKENRHPRRRAAVVDRITLKRTSTANSVSSNGSAAGSGRLAFTAPSAGASGFKVPALLRRATTNSLMSNSSGSGSSATGTSAGAGGFGDEAKIKKAAGKRSGINYFARENERRAAMAENEKRREARKLKGVEGRSRVVGGLFGGGKFE